MSYAEPINEGPFGGVSPFGGHAFTPPPWAKHGMRHHGRRIRMMMTEMDDTAAGDHNRAGDNGPADEVFERPEGRRHRGGHRRGPGGPGFGPGPWGGRGPWGPPRGRRRERGDVRAAVLLLLAEQPRHGYELLTELADRSDGQWQPSPGSIYPVLKRLARDGLVTSTQTDGKRIFSLTDEGRALVEAERESWGEPWAQSGEPDTEAAMELWGEGRQLGAAVWQVSQLNDPEQVAAATAILVEARKRIYGLLAQ
jgi:DNA-binding PadR family transcriptional regulator